MSLSANRADHLQEGGKRRNKVGSARPALNEDNPSFWSDALGACDQNNVESL